MENILRLKRLLFSSIDLSANNIMTAEELFSHVLFESGYLQSKTPMSKTQVISYLEKLPLNGIVYTKGGLNLEFQYHQLI